MREEYEGWEEVGVQESGLGELRLCFSWPCSLEPKAEPGRLCSPTGLSRAFPVSLGITGPGMAKERLSLRERSWEGLLACSALHTAAGQFGESLALQSRLL